MLQRLSIRNIVLIDRLDIDLAPGLCVITGETGAGKSIFLDALGLALGFRADSGLLGENEDQASVTAVFALPENHPAHAMLHEQGLEPETGNGLVLRRVLSADGRSRAYIDDQPVSASFLRHLGDSLVEIEGQFAQQGLMNPASHRHVLDGYGGLETLAAQSAHSWHAWQKATDDLKKAEDSADQMRQEATVLQADLDELTALDPQAGEIESLEQRRHILKNSEKLTQSLDQAYQCLSSDGPEGGVDAIVQSVYRELERVASLSAGRFDPALAALERAGIELAEALNHIQTMQDDCAHNPSDLEMIDDRIHALRRIARKHGADVDRLPDLRSELSTRLQQCDTAQIHMHSLREAAKTARQQCQKDMGQLSGARQQAARTLDEAVMAELPALKLEHAQIATRLTPIPEENWNAHGGETVTFMVSTNPGTALAPLDRIASGGELSRFMLALKLVAAKVGPVPTLVFDEVDSGIGGAVAAAVGQRLARLGHHRQVLVVTHSPQVAAAGAHHWRVHKDQRNARSITEIQPLSNAERQEEIARMLSASEITEEARAAAARLMGGTHPS